MIIQLNMQSDVPIYNQLINQIIEGIASGELQPGEPLPSVRSLAADIGINLHTVNKAYNFLKQDGYIQVHRQRGVVVHPDGPPEMTPEYEEKRDQQLKPMIAEAICRGMNEQQLKDAVSTIYREITRTRKGEK